MYNQSQNSDDGFGCLIVTLLIIYSLAYFTGKLIVNYAF